MTMKKYGGIQWIVQRDDEAKRSGLRKACADIGVDYVEVDLIPFTNELPSFPTGKRSIFYGSTTFAGLVYANSDLNGGLFFNENFSMANYMDKWGTYMLNGDATITTFRDLMDMDWDHDRMIFVRPDEDTKSFTGSVKSFGEIGKWYESLLVFQNTNLDLGTRIIVGEPHNIAFEWRLWIVNKKVVAASKYREHFQLRPEKGCPNEVVAFAEERCLEYTPHDAFVMDVCLCGDGHYIVECGCVNAAGFYKANVRDIVEATTNYFESTKKEESWASIEKEMPYDVVSSKMLRWLHANYNPPTRKGSK